MMKLLIFAVLTLMSISTCALRAPAKETEKERELGTHYTYTLDGLKLEREDLIAIFTDVSDIELAADFFGDWTSSDNDGIEYSLSTRRGRIMVDYQGDDQQIAEQAKDKALELKEKVKLEKTVD